MFSEGSDHYMRILDINSSQILASLDNEINQLSRDTSKVDSQSQNPINRTSENLFKIETNPRPKRLNISKSTTTMRKLGLFGQKESRPFSSSFLSNESRQFNCRPTGLDPQGIPKYCRDSHQRHRLFHRNGKLFFIR